MLTIICLTALIALVWLFTALIQGLRRRCTTAANEDATSRRNASLTEVSMNNFMVRFLLEVFFELMICALLNLSSLQGDRSWWLVSLFTLTAGLLAILALSSLFCRRGPYVAHTYAPATLLGSFWGERALHEDLKRSAVVGEDLLTLTDSKAKDVDNVAIMGVADDTKLQGSLYSSNVPLNQQMFAAVKVGGSGSGSGE